MFQKQILGLDMLQEVADQLIDSFENERIFALYGSMGAGKTTFIKALCKTLGSTDNVTSPTFAIVNEYNSGNAFPIYHFDFYRIKKLEEAFDLGYEDYIYSNNYCFIEWPELIDSLLPKKYVEVRISETLNRARLVEAKLVLR